MGEYNPASGKPPVPACQVEGAAGSSIR